MDHIIEKEKVNWKKQEVIHISEYFDENQNSVYRLYSVVHLLHSTPNSTKSILPKISNRNVCFVDQNTSLFHIEIMKSVWKDVYKVFKVLVANSQWAI